MKRDLEYRLLSRDDHPSWDAFVDKSPQGSIYAKSVYLDACDRDYQVGVLEQNGQIQAGIVLVKNELRMYANPLLAKHLGVLVRPIEGTYANRLTTEVELVSALVEHLGDYRSFNYAFHPAFENWLPFYWAGYRQETRYTYQIRDLSDLEQVRSAFKVRVRRSLKKAERSEIRIDTGISGDQLYDVIDKSFRRQGAPPPFSREFTLRYCRRLAEVDNIQLLGAVDGSGTVHAAAGVVYDHRSANLVLSGVDHSLPSTGANTALMVACISAASKTSELFDFEGSMIPEIESYYRGFGGELTPYFMIWRPGVLTGFSRTAVKLLKRVRYGR